MLLQTEAAYKIKPDIPVKNTIRDAGNFFDNKSSVQTAKMPYEIKSSGSFIVWVMDVMAISAAAVTLTPVKKWLADVYWRKSFQSENIEEHQQSSQ